MLAWLRQVGELLAGRQDPEAVGAQPNLELMNQVQIRVPSPAHSGVVAFPFAIIVAPTHVDSCCPADARNAITSVKVKPEVADLEGHKFSDAETADGREGDHKSVTVVTHMGRPHPEHGGDEDAVDWEQKGKSFIFSLAKSKTVSETRSLWCSRTLKHGCGCGPQASPPDQPTVQTASGSVRELHSTNLGAA